MGFKKLKPEDIVVSSNQITSTVWTGNVPTLTTFSTSSAQQSGATKAYYLDVYNTGSDEGELQFSIAYGNKTGGGGTPFQSTIPDVTPTTVIYGQYRSMLLEDENAEFLFGEVARDDFYVISIERSKYKERLLPGSFKLNLDGLILVDNSSTVSLPTYLGSQRAYQLVKETSGDYFDNGTKESYGLFFPDTATIILNANALDTDASLATDRGASDANNPLKLYNKLSASPSFTLNSQETITSDYIFVRLGNSEFNYSENPSFISGSTGEVIHDYFIYNPSTYPTTVGLYNDNNELLAVAKLSKPVAKDFTKEALIRVKLDF